MHAHHGGVLDLVAAAGSVVAVFLVATSKKFVVLQINPRIYQLEVITYFLLPNINSIIVFS